ncbi:MAG: WecB/TagA/CpsF family glycosyltransferase [Rubrivivax sp.]|jgi:N-acetylglucosaminyldiphosphoundecaprenol N-acetyl-beta-D-mannosaminyltransferase|nr:WecB/TagA/CpsF family glycosyltransferase [Rubrivivax sp.]
MAHRAVPPDFSRDVHCVFGLPLDAVTEDQALYQLQHAARSGTRCFLSTPNLSFAAGCMADVDFRQSVVNSDLSTADGAPIVWLARLMGAPLPERVTGSNLFDRLSETSSPPVSVYLFGGPDGTAERAAQQLRARHKAGVDVVGWCSPGFAPLEAISGPAFTDPINAAAPQFVVVALGARKGQAWIERNWPQLQAPVISHLGAVINFVAGTVTRAPRWVQRTGMEWLWRIKEEPELWRRYWNDGRTFLKYLFTGALPWAVVRVTGRLGGAGPNTPLVITQVSGTQQYVLEGAAINGDALLPLRQLFARSCQDDAALSLDLRGLTQLGTGFIALLQLMDAWHRARFGRGTVVHASAHVRRALRWAGAHHLLDSTAADQGADPTTGARAVALPAAGAYSRSPTPSRNGHGDDQPQLAEPRAAYRR